MKMLSSIPAATSVSAVWEMRVGDDENERVPPSSLSLSLTLCAMLDSSKVFTSQKSKSGELYDKMSLINPRSGGLPGGIPPHSETSCSEVDCIYEWTDFSLSSLHYIVSSLVKKLSRIDKGVSSLNVDPSLPPPSHNPQKLLHMALELCPGSHMLNHLQLIVKT